MSFLESRLAMVLLTLILISTSVYIFPSGMPQPSHLLLLLPLFFLMRSLRSTKLDLPERLLLLFWAYSTSVNLFYWFLHGETGFLIASAHISYGVLLLLTFRHIFQVQPRLSICMLWTLLCVVPLLLYLAFFGGDALYFFKGRRLMGLFNDPNQMSYWLLIFLTASLLSPYKPAWLTPTLVAALLIPIWLLVFLAGSRSALLGLLFLTLAIGWWFFQDRYQARLVPMSGKGVLLSAAGTMLLLFLCLFLLYLFIEPVNSAAQDLWRRANGRSLLSHLEMRGYFRPFDMPEYLLFGAGQGFESRFSTRLLEIHSSLVAPLFYYGIIGWLLFYGFVYTLVRDRLSGWQWLVMAAPFIYGLFTYGLRTPVFWLMLASLYAITPTSRGSVVSNEKIIKARLSI